MGGKGRRKQKSGKNWGEDKMKREKKGEEKGRKQGRKGMLEVTRAVNNPGKPMQIHNDTSMTQLNSFPENLSGLD